MLTRLLAATVFTVSTGVALAEPLPKDAKPLSAAQITRIYSGNSTEWTDSGAHFAPDGTVKGRYKGGIFWGRWVVRQNEICMERVKGYDIKSNETWDGRGDCWKWWVDSEGGLITLWSRHFDGTKPNPKTDHYRTEIKVIKKGDKISKTFDKVYAKIKT